ncbi:hypothetical protein GJ496_009736 [Pomphorhynchus laevis]|nr:hypothetical protein GJ496_009736 [Pomphorhynchus laevis]
MKNNAHEKDISTNRANTTLFKAPGGDQQRISQFKRTNAIPTTKKQAETLRKVNRANLIAYKNIQTPKCYICKGNNRDLLVNILKKLNFVESDVITGDVDFRWVGSISNLLNKDLDWGDLINHIIGESTFTTNIQLPETIPETFMLDSKRDRDKLASISTNQDFWITKPANGSRGVGINLITSKEELLNLIKTAEEDNVKKFFFKPQQRIVQRYLTNTLLINGRKFDIRAYMIIASTTPLLVLHHPGYARLSLNKYSNVDRNIVTHLTNQCIQMKESNYEYEKESTAWSMEQLNEYINLNVQKNKNLPVDWTLKVLPKIQRQILMRVIESVRSRLTRKVGCFGLYGVDFIIDETFHVWLLEINLGPALITNTRVLKEVIPPVLENCIRVAIECYDKTLCGVDLLPLSMQSDLQIVYSEKYDRKFSFDQYSLSGAVHSKKRRQRALSLQRLQLSEQVTAPKL